ncbi:MAG: hypothetical protein AB1640_02540 [bacterium]
MPTKERGALPVRRRAADRQPQSAAPSGFEEYCRAHQKESIFERERGQASTWTLFLHGDSLVTGSISGSETYECNIRPGEGSEEKVHKVRVKFLCPAAVHEEVTGQMKRNEEVQRRKEGPHFLPRFRHAMEDRTLFELMTRREVLFFTMLEGEILRGIIRSFSSYEIVVGMRREVPVILLRHAIYDVRDKRGKSYVKKPATGKARASAEGAPRDSGRGPADPLPRRGSHADV